MRLVSTQLTSNYQRDILGMSEHDVMILAGHSSFATTHEFYLAVADDLVDRARVATAQGLRQKLVRFDTPPF